MSLNNNYLNDMVIYDNIKGTDKTHKTYYII